MAKLYSHVSRFMVRKHINRKKERKLKWALTLNPGDLINDCSGFNVRVRDIYPCYIQTSKGWYIYDVQIELEPNGNYCSLINCGVIPSLSRNQVEFNWLEWAQNYINSGSLKRWYAEDIFMFNKQLNIMINNIDRIKNGKHITDESGCLLDRFRYLI